mmetsp:Transcript_55441/g.104109  ORF Transcript_55441/g.104109 Transcript_55441/m.104109 type:complete len:289 (-) Transcript_55441:41-907(-)
MDAVEALAPRRHKDRRGAFLPGPRRRADLAAFFGSSRAGPGRPSGMCEVLAAGAAPRLRPALATPIQVSAMLPPDDASLEDLRGTPSESLEPVGPWVVQRWQVPLEQELETAGPPDLQDPLDDEVWDRGSAGPHEQAEHHRPHAVEHLEHHPHDDMTDVGVALISSGTTIFLAFMSAVFAMRLFRELMRPPPQQLPGFNPTEGDVPGVVQLDIPGVQPFRPFAGQGYRLVLEPPEEAKPPTPAGPSSEKEVTPRSLSPVSPGARPSTTGGAVPHFGEETEPEVTAPAN